MLWQVWVSFCMPLQHLLQAQSVLVVLVVVLDLVLGLAWNAGRQLTPIPSQLLQGYKTNVVSYS